MKTSQKLIEDEQYLKDENGAIKFVVIPIKKYKKLVELMEDYGLGLAMKEAEEENASFA